MDALSAAVIVKALDGLSTRMIATAQNVANAQSPGYRPLRVSFEEALTAASQRGQADVRAVEPRIEAEPVVDGSADLRLDQELATASATALRYGALVDMLTRRLEIDRLAIRGGR